MKYSLAKQLIAVILSAGLVYASTAPSLAQHSSLAVPGVQEITISSDEKKKSEFISLSELSPPYDKVIYIKELVSKLREQLDELQRLWGMLVLTKKGERGVLYKKFLSQYKRITQFIDNKYKEQILNRVEAVAIFHSLKNDISVMYAIKNYESSILSEIDDLPDWNITKIVDKAFNAIFDILSEYSHIEFPVNIKGLIINNNVVMLTDAMQAPIFSLNLHLNAALDLSGTLREKLISPGQYSDEDMSQLARKLLELILTLLIDEKLCKDNSNAFEMTEKALVVISGKFSSIKSTSLDKKYNLGQSIRDACEYVLTQLQDAIPTEKDDRLKRLRKSRGDFQRSH